MPACKNIGVLMCKDRKRRGKKNNVIGMSCNKREGCNSVGILCNMKEESCVKRQHTTKVSSTCERGGERDWDSCVS